MTELLPCPFCGRQPEVIHHNTETEATWCEWEIECTHGYEKPTIQGKSGDEWCFDFGYAGDNLETVIKHWNTRHERTCRPIWKQSKQQGRLTDTCECSECCGCLDDLGVGIDGGVFPYCPYCGAKVVDP